eukprot:2916989-Rhodomonas_salina.1
MGYGDITPVTTVEVAFTILVILQGGITFSYIVGNMANLLSRINLYPPPLLHPTEIAPSLPFPLYKPSISLPYLFSQRSCPHPLSLFSSYPPSSTFLQPPSIPNAYLMLHLKHVRGARREEEREVLASVGRRGEERRERGAGEWRGRWEKEWDGESG